MNVNGKAELMMIKIRYTEQIYKLEIYQWASQRGFSMQYMVCPFG